MSNLDIHPELLHAVAKLESISNFRKEMEAKYGTPETEAEVVMLEEENSNLVDAIAGGRAILAAVETREALTAANVHPDNQPLKELTDEIKGFCDLMGC